MPVIEGRCSECKRYVWSDCHASCCTRNRRSFDTEEYKGFKKMVKLAMRYKALRDEYEEEFDEKGEDDVDTEKIGNIMENLALTTNKMREMIIENNWCEK
jgi:hypothetical protein